jgi:molybdopterin molybdotransferase
MLEFDEAQKLLTEAVQPMHDCFEVALEQAAGRVLAEPLTAVLDQPPADNSAMDGYAIRHDDYRAGVALPVSQTIYAGQPAQPLQPGSAARLFTGSLIPAGADTVIMQEDTRAADGRVEITTAPQPGQHVRKRGEGTAAGSLLMEAGTLLRPEHIAMLGSQGMPRAKVHAPVRIGILTTGDELVAPGLPRLEHQIYNSNGPMLAALAGGMGANVTRVLHASDDEAGLRDAFQVLARDADLILSVGGVSVGDRDLVKPVLESLGAPLDLWKVRMKPGKPVTLAKLGKVPVVGLPGNPVSAYVVFTLLVTPMLRRLQGRKDIFPQTGMVTLRTPKPCQDSREEFLRVRRVPNAAGVPELHVFDRQSSGVISSLPFASGLARIPAGMPVYDGEKVAYYDFRHWLV